MRRYGALGLAFLAAVAVVYWPSLPGPFLSDDIMYIGLNPYVQVASLENVRAILDPFGDMALMSANWAPVHLLTHMLEWQLFGANVAAYHLTNVVLHVAASLLLVALLAATGVPAAAAAFGGAFFLLHPANVEAVAWISQLKTILALVLMLSALLLRERHPAFATLSFVLAILCKALAAVALPMAFVLDRARPSGDGAGRGARRATLVAWGLALAAFAGIELAAFLYQSAGSPQPSLPLETRLWSSVAIGTRYLAMAATGIGVSTFHEPAPVASPLDPWVLAGLAAGAVLGARLFATLRRRRAEAAWWVLAAGSFAPVAQLLPFLYPMADRYLYFILPGLLGGVLLAGREALAALAPGIRRRAELAAAAAAGVACLHFAFVSHARAALWVSDARVMADAVRHYPEGSMAHYVRARGAARDRDPARAAAELRLAARNPAFGFHHVRIDPQLKPVQRSPEFQALLRDLAREQIERNRDAERLTEADLISLAQAQLTVDDAAGALATLERALAVGGGFEAVARVLHTHARALVQAEADAARASADEGPARSAPAKPRGAP